MNTNNLDPNDLRVELEVTREKLRSSEEKNLLQEKALKEVQTRLSQQENAVKRALKELNELKIELEVTKQKLIHTESMLDLSRRSTVEKSLAAKEQAFYASLLFLGTTLLTGIGANLLTSTPPNPLGWMMICVASVVYAIAARMAAFPALGE